MFSHYLKTGWRNLLRYRLNSLINIVGLSLGLAAFSLILFFVSDELSYDRHLEDSDRMYRVILHGVVGGNTITLPSVPAPLARTLLDDQPMVGEAVRMRGTTRGADPVTVTVGDRRYRESRLIYADSTFFDFFGIDLEQGDPLRALASPNSVVLTRSAAHKYFPGKKAIGQTLHLSGLDQDFTVTGIAEALPPNTHFRYEVVASLVTDPRSRGESWLGGSVMTYLKLGDPDQATRVNAWFPGLVRERVVPQLESFMGVPFSQFLNQGGTYRYYLQPVEEIHLGSHLDTEWEANGNRTYVWLFAFVGLVIAVIAGINFTNLATSQSSRRAREVGLRKALGAYRGELALQHLAESLLLTLFASGLGLLLIQLALPVFNRLTGKEFALHQILEPGTLLLYLGITLLLGLAAGLYPALYLSRMSPRSSIAGAATSRMRNGSGGGGLLRGTLVAFQFLVSTGLIIGTLVINSQIDYLQSRDMGLQTERIVVVDKAGDLGNRRAAFRAELLSRSGIEGAAFSSTVPGRAFGRAAYQPDLTDETMVLPVITVDAGFLEVYGIDLAQGRPFSDERSAEHLGVLLNRRALRSAPWEEAVGRTFNSEMSGALPLEVIGIVEDFHFQSLHHEIQPLVIEHVRPEDVLNVLSVKLQEGQVERGLKELEATWAAFLPGVPIEYANVESIMQRLYGNDEELAFLVRVFAILGILIACMGLLGMMAHTTENRKKEVGVRKVLGSSTISIVALFMRRMALPVGVGAGLALPLSYVLMNRWLQDFAYHGPLTAGPFLLGLGITLLLGVAAVGHIVLRAAAAKPVHVLQTP